MTFHGEEFSKNISLFYKEMLRHNFDFFCCLSQHTRRFIEISSQNDEEMLELSSRLLNQEEIMSKAKDIAVYYIQNKKFPEIVIIFDVIIHGRGITYFIENFKKELYLYLTEFSNTELDRALCESITIWSYFLNDDPLLIQHEYQWRIHYEKMERLLVWRTPIKYIYDTIKISKYGSANIFPDINYVEPSKEVKDELDLRAYSLGVEHECSAKSFENTYASGKNVDVNLLCNTGRMYLKDFIYGIKGSFDEIITHVISLLDDGYISLHVEETNRKKRICYLLYIINPTHFTQ